MNSNENPPAFPRPASEFTKNGTCPDGNDPVREQSGMSLRDYFAAHALLALPHMGCGADLEQIEFAKAAYQIADHMLAARVEGEGGRV